MGPHPLLARRSFIAGAAAAISARRALGQIAIAPGINPPDNSAALTPDCHISYGQSWRSNTFDSFASPFAFSQQTQTLLACHTTTVGLPTSLPGPLPNSAGVNLPGTIDGLTGYASTDSFTIGRCAVLAQQLLRLRANIFINPILEFCAAYPGSTWTTGGGGGLQPGGTSWTNQLTILAALHAFAAPLPFFALGRIGKLKSPIFRSVGYTQGGSEVDTIAAKVADLTAMLNDYNGLGLPGAGLNFYIGISAPVSNTTVMAQSQYGSAVFCRANAPGQGGTFSGNCFASSPWYQWPFDGVSNIHTNDYGSARNGEFEGLCRHIVQDLGVAWTPLWLSLTQPITVSGQNITIPIDRPAGPHFSSGSLSWISDPNDGIKVWPQYGFSVKRGGIDLTVTPTIQGMNIVLTISETMSPGDILEVSYAFYGPGGSSPGTCSGVGGNLGMVGPPSVLFPNNPAPGNTINAWCWPFDTTVTA